MLVGGWVLSVLSTAQRSHSSQPCRQLLCRLSFWICFQQCTFLWLHTTQTVFFRALEWECQNRAAWLLIWALNLSPPSFFPKCFIRADLMLNAERLFFVPFFFTQVQTDFSIRLPRFLFIYINSWLCCFTVICHCHWCMQNEELGLKIATTHLTAFVHQCCQ